MKRLLCSAAFLAASLTSAPVLAQASVDTPVTAGPRSALPGATEIWVAPKNDITSASLHEGDTFDVTVSRDVLFGNYMVIPRGTPGHARITWRTGRGLYGKSAKIEFDLTDIVVADAVVPITGHYRLAGRGNTAATIGVGIAAGVIAAAFVTGHSAEAPRNTEWKALTLAPVAVGYDASNSDGELSPYEQGKRLARMQMLRSGLY